MARFTGLVAPFTTDRVGDMFARRAFDQTIREWRISGDEVPLVLEHGDDAVIGGIDSLDVNDEGLVGCGYVDTSSAAGKQAWSDLKVGRAAFSAGFKARRTPRDDQPGDVLSDVDLLEVCVTSRPTSVATRLLSIERRFDEQRQRADALERELAPPRITTFAC